MGGQKYNKDDKNLKRIKYGQKFKINKNMAITLKLTISNYFQKYNNF